MAILHNPDSGYSKERRKWEALHSDVGPGERPYVYREFPKMVFRAGRPDGGNLKIVETLIADSDLTERNLLSRGFFPSQQAALEASHAADRAVATAAAELNADLRRVGEQARTEAEAAIRDADGHLGEIPRTPVRRPGRPRKVVSPA
jgi:hypothetical protein